MGTEVALELIDRGGNPVDLWRTVNSHGLASLPPAFVDTGARALEITLPVPGSRPRTVAIGPAAAGRAKVLVRGRPPGRAALEAVIDSVRRILRFDEDLSDFYAQVERDPDLAWARAGAGRMMRSATVFEEVIKTICTTNCAWSATERMVGGLVEHLGERAPGAPEQGPRGRAFPAPQAMAAAGEHFYKDVIRAGYRGPYLIRIAGGVADGSLDLEVLGSAPSDELSDEEVEARLFALPGVGPYAAAHIMLMLGRYSRLILDSWTRPTYARLAGRKSVSDAAIQRRFKRYGRYAGLAFWLYLTRDWVTDEPIPVGDPLRSA
jgi:N-glycosylase/DNA lyase